MNSDQIELAYWVTLSQVDGIGPANFARLLKIYKSAQKVWEEKNLEKLKLDVKTLENFKNLRNQIDPVENLKNLKKQEIKVVGLFEENYPENLKQIFDPPPFIYYRGNLKPADRLSLAVVGSRKMTSYGRSVTEEMAYGAVQAGLTVVSGMARGVDSVAHISAIEAGGRTIAFMGSGINQIYPPDNKNLYYKIIQKGAVLCEYPPEYPALPGNFPSRNRLISGFSLGVLITEAARDSGSLITANSAIEQGREVFCVPGSISSPLSEGPNELIKNGAKLTSKITDILEELNIDEKFEGKREIIAENKDEEILLTLLVDASKHIDQLVKESRLETPKVLSTLTILEISGKVKNLGNGEYKIGR